MTHNELKELMVAVKTPMADAKKQKLVRDFWFHTGLTQKFFLSLPEEESMELWARFVIERMEEVS